MKRKTRNNCNVGAFEKKYVLPLGTFRKSNGRDNRSDKTICRTRKETEEE